MASCPSPTLTSQSPLAGGSVHPLPWNRCLLRDHHQGQVHCHHPAPESQWIWLSRSILLPWLSSSQSGSVWRKGPVLSSCSSRECDFKRTKALPGAGWAASDQVRVSTQWLTQLVTSCSCSPWGGGGRVSKHRAFAPRRSGESLPQCLSSSCGKKSSR